MISLPGYTIHDLLILHADTAVYRGHCDADQTPVLIKVPTGAYPTPETITRLKDEYETISELTGTGIVQVRGQEPYEQTSALILKDPGGVPLSEIINPDLGTLFDIALLTIQALDTIHQHQKVYCNTSPNSILYNAQSNTVTFVEFESTAQTGTAGTPGPLAYMAPEQTGRINHVIDHRTDFYALGAMLYELLVGIKPFESTDPAEMIHAHIARIPKAPNQISSDIPSVVSDMIMKLLSKTAEDRYQSTQGLKADLETCKKQWQTDNTIVPFELGLQEQAGSFRIPNKLYGREAERQTIHQAFDQVCQGDRRLILIHGPSGIGKTALVEDLQRAIAHHNAYFISGKSDQFQRNVPYASLIQAFRDLVHQLLTESQDRLELWRQTLRQTLGANAQIIIDVIPEVELIIGTQAPVRPLPLSESHNRFNLVFCRFVSLFARPQHPLIIFLDDLQWADIASLNLLRHLLTDTRTAHLLLVGSYRDEEIHPNHPLSLLQDELKKANTTTETVTLQPLVLDQIHQLLAETLQTTDRIQSLSELIYERTEGNPFFINQYLTVLYERNLLNFDAQSATWQWNHDDIRTNALTDNVVSLMASRIQDLPQQVQNALVLGACIGNQFDLDTLSLLCEQSSSDTIEYIWAAVQAGLLLPADKGRQESDQATYRFLHDRLQQAAYTRIPETERSIFHLKIGRLLYKQNHPNRIEDAIFDIVDQHNAGQNHIDDPKERIELARLNLIAGEKAITATAYDSAQQYLRAGIQLLPDTAWQDHYELTLSLHQQQGICDYLLGQFDTAEACFDIILNHVQNDMDKVKAYMVKVRLYTHQEETAKALKLGLESLRLLNISLSSNPGKATVARQLLKVKWLLRKHDIDALVDLPPMTAERPQLAIELLTELLSPAYFFSAELYALLVLTMMQLVLQHGNTESAPFVFAQYAAIISGGLSQYETAYALGQMALKLCENNKQSLWIGRTYLTRGAILNHWRQPARENLTDLQITYDQAIENDDHLYAVWANRFGVLTRIFLGIPINETTEFLNRASTFAQQIRHEEFSLTAAQHLLETLSGENVDFDEAEYLKTVTESGDSASLVTFHIFRLMALYLVGDDARALQSASTVHKGLFATFGQLLEVEYRFYHALVLARSQKLNQTFRTHLKKMRLWSDTSPDNFQARLLILQAEKARMQSQTQEAMARYDQAISTAQNNGQIHIASLANELAGAFYFSLNRESIARTYLLESRYGYLRWGAVHKVRLLEQTYPNIFGTVQNTPVSISEPSGSSVDFISVMKASHVLSGEIAFDRLLNQLIDIVIENAGAQRGFLILQRDEDLFVETLTDISETKHAIETPIAITDCVLVPESLIRYVARTREATVLDNAVQSTQFSDDPYIHQNQPKSVLCMPIEHQSKLTGVLYLENNLTTEAFTPDRLEVLTLLCAQAAISIENARLYTQLEEHSHTLEQRVEERTRELKETQDQLITEMQRELQTAHNLQMSLMPKESPQITGLDVSGRCIPTTHVGGDCFHYFHPLSERFFVSLADVTGHAMEAAIPVVMFDGVLDSQMERGGVITDVFSRLNQTLCRKLDDRTFVCFVMAEIDPHSRSIRMSNAGCPYPFHYRAETRDVVELQIDAYPLGVTPRTDYQELSLKLQPNDRLIFCSDGIIEAENSSGEQFDYERTISTICEACDMNLSSENVIDWLMNAVDAFRGDMPRQDDMTCVIVRVD